ncbi:hypothetical protein FB192DRAFT_1405647 [Mucor lusitanicus]|uniref:Arrestin C-terminal-like domain-containing protein n=1 Tax=Mucor circinelloides f. lusitanicus TaxID=29924 RepID=A0A8H4B5X2_MUCCL|nr:hypothetical protein FB192DRAFT_1405647 [Mucor lusitanicus]
MVKPILSIKLKESHSYYSQDETIPCIVNFKSEKVLKEGFIRIQFMGRSSSYCNGSRQHLHSIFNVEKEIKIDEWNNAANVKKMHQVEFTVEVPNGKEVPSYRNLEGSDGGKIEYMIEASLETPGGLFKKSNVLANHIIQVPLIAKVNITENGLERHRESSIRWPKIEENVNTCALSARIPHEGCVRGKEVPVHVDFQQPERFEAVKFIKLALIQQEIIASSKDKIPEMTKQLPDRIIKTEDKPVAMAKDMYNPQLLTTSSLIMITIPSNATPTISGTMARVMRMDYKIRVTVLISAGAENNGKEKELNVNLPLVVGTAGQHPILHDSGVDTMRHSEQMSYNPYSNPYPPNNMNTPGYPAPPPHHGGFQMPDPFQVPPQQPYPATGQHHFMLNPQHMSPFAGASSASDYEGGMPVPQFSTTPEQSFSTATSPVSDQAKSFVYPPVALSSQMGSLSVSTTTNPFSSTAHAADSAPYPPPPLADKAPFSPTYENKTDAETLASSLSRESTRSTAHTSSSTVSHSLYPPPSLLSIDKPNTPTPPQTPAVINRNISQQRPTSRQIESGSSYHSGVSVFDDASYSSSPPQASHIATRIDPLEGTIVLSNVTNK